MPTWGVTNEIRLPHKG